MLFCRLVLFSSLCLLFCQLNKPTSISPNTNKMNRRELVIEKLGLIPHPEGGFFKETYRSGTEPMQSKGATDINGRLFDYGGQGRRNLMTSIYWMLTKESKYGWWIRNQSDHVHYHIEGTSISYRLIDPEGNLSVHVLGKDLANGEEMQLVVPGGWWKSAEIGEGDFALIGEAVAPGFDYHDFVFGTQTMFEQFCPEAATEYGYLIRPNPLGDFEDTYS